MSRRDAAPRVGLGVGLRLALALAALGLGGAVVAAADGDPADPTADPVAALEAGNGLFRDGRLEEAVAAYRAGWDPSRPNPTLLYNLGTTLHHLDRLPEAILWYRRAAGSDDPWLDENLWLARRTLGSRSLPPHGLLGLVARAGHPIELAAIVLAWAALLLWIGWPRFAGAALAAAALALGLWGAAAGAEQWGPRAVVVLEDCATGGGDLPAGSEAWASRDGDGPWRISGVDGGTCPPSAAEAVFPAGP